MLRRWAGILAECREPERSPADSDELDAVDERDLGSGPVTGSGERKLLYSASA